MGILQDHLADKGDRIGLCANLPIAAMAVTWE